MTKYSARDIQLFRYCLIRLNNEIIVYSSAREIKTRKLFRFGYTCTVQIMNANTLFMQYNNSPRTSDLIRKSTSTGIFHVYEKRKDIDVFGRNRLKG